MRPAGRFVMSDLDQVGGLPVVLRELLDAGLVDGSAITVNGKTLAENVADAAAARRQGRAAGQRPAAAARAGSRCCAAAWRPTAPW